MQKFAVGDTTERQGAGPSGVVTGLQRSKIGDAGLGGLIEERLGGGVEAVGGGLGEDDEAQERHFAVAGDQFVFALVDLLVGVVQADRHPQVVALTHAQVGIERYGFGGDL